MIKKLKKIGYSQDILSQRAASVGKGTCGRDFHAEQAEFCLWDSQGRKGQLTLSGCHLTSQVLCDTDTHEGGLDRGSIW